MSEDVDKPAFKKDALRKRLEHATKVRDEVLRELGEELQKPQSPIVQMRGGDAGITFSAVPLFDQVVGGEGRKQGGLAALLTEWWVQTAKEDAARTVPKVVEYGSADLEVMGYAMQYLIRPDVKEELSAAEVKSLGIEMALGFYALGKVARAFGAYADGRPASSDTWFDLQTYATMCRYVREHGSWP